MPRLFVSYGRCDARELAQRLAGTLRAAGHQVWLDVDHIAGGAAWSLAIEQAIDESDAVLALLSPASYASLVCRAEQGRAHRKRKTMIPVLAVAGADRALFVETLQWIDFTDDLKFDAAVADLLDVLAGRKALATPARRTPGRVVAVPDIPHFVPRDDEMAALRTAVLADLGSEEVVMAAIRGMAGAGKTVLAAALCHDPAIRDAFTDGIVWVTLGAEGRLLEKLSEVGQRLGDADARYPTVDTARERLTGLLEDAAVLVVVDDVWRTEHILPFRLRAPRSRIVFTTRISTVVHVAGATVVPLGSMTPAQAVRLLETASGRREPEGFAAIAERVGYLPLALKLAGARLAQGLGAADWLERFTTVSRMRTHRAAADRDDNLAVSIEVSVRELAENDRRRFHQLGVFREDVPVPLDAVRRAWRTTRDEAAETMDELDRLALVEVDRGRGAVALHDVIRLYAREALGDLPEANRELLAAWNPGGGPWSSIEDDGYAHAHLVHHFLESRTPGHVHALLRETDAEGRNAWFRTRRDAGDLGGYVSDLDTASRLAARVSDDILYALCRSSVHSVSLEIPPELVMALVHRGIWTPGRARHFAGEIVDAGDQVRILLDLAAAAEGDERYERLRAALGRARGTPHRRLALVALARAGHAADAVSALAASPPTERADDAVAIVPYAGGSEQRALLAMARTLGVWDEGKVLVALLGHAVVELRGEAAERAVELAAITGAGRMAGQLCSAAVAALGETPRAAALMPSALEAIFGMPDGVEVAVERVAPAIVAAGFAAQAIEGIDRCVMGTDDRARALGALAVHLPDDQRVGIARQVAAYAGENIWDSHAAVGVAMLLDVAPELHEELVEAACALAGRCRLYGEPFVKLVQRLPRSALPRLTAMLGRIEAEYDRPALLEEVLRRNAGPEVLAAATAVARATVAAVSRGEMLALIARYAPAEQRERWTAEALREAAGAEAGDDPGGDERGGVAVALRVLDLLGDEARPAAVERIFAAARRDRVHGVDRLVGLAGVARDGELWRIADMAAGRDIAERRRLLAAVAPRMSREALAAVLDRLGRIGDAREAASVAAGLGALAGTRPAARIPGTVLRAMFDDLPHALFTIDAEAEALRLLGSEFARRGAIDEAVQATAILLEHPSTIPLAEGVARWLPPERVDALMAPFLRAHEEARVFFLRPLLPYATPGARRRIVADLLRIARTAAQAAALVPFVDDTTRRGLIPVPVDAPDLRDAFGFGPLIALLPYLDRAQLDAAWRRAQAHHDRERSVQARFLLASRMPERLDRALDDTHAMAKLQRPRFLAVHETLFASAADRSTIHAEAMRAAASLGDASTAEAMIGCLVGDQVTTRDVVECLRTTIDVPHPSRLALLAVLVPHLVLRLDTASLRAALHDALLVASRRPRTDLLADLRVLRVPLWRVAEPSSMRDVAEHVLRVVDWWP